MEKQIAAHLLMSFLQFAQLESGRMGKIQKVGDGAEDYVRGRERKNQEIDKK